MTTTPPVDEIEIWESTIAGRVSVTVENHRGRPKNLTTIGQRDRMRLTAAERELAEEQVRDPQNNPFRNGMLLLVNRRDDSPEPSPDELSDDDLMAMFDLEIEDFEGGVRSLSEVNVRRLKALAQPEGSWSGAAAGQITFIDEHIQEKWPLGSDTPTYREMNKQPE